MELIGFYGDETTSEEKAHLISQVFMSDEDLDKEKEYMRERFFANEISKSVNSKVCLKHLGYYLGMMNRRYGQTYHVTHYSLKVESK